MYCIYFKNIIRTNTLFRRILLMFTKTYASISKQIFKGQVTDIISTLMSFFSCFFFKTTVFKFAFWYSTQYLGSSVIDYIGKTVFTAELLTVANTLDKSTDQTIRTKQSLLACTRHYSEATTLVYFLCSGICHYGLDLYILVQINSYSIVYKQMYFIDIVTTRERIHNLFFPFL